MCLNTCTIKQLDFIFKFFFFLSKLNSTSEIPTKKMLTVKNHNICNLIQLKVGAKTIPSL